MTLFDNQQEGDVPENAIARVAESPVVAADANAIMAIISRAASDPNTDVDKLERLTGLYERISAQTARAAYLAAMANLQPELPVITERGGIKDRAGNVQSTYAKWEDINDAIKPVLQRHGFALSFRTGQEGASIIVTGVLGHRDGHVEETTIHLPADGSGSKNSVQAVGSSTSYGKRYTAMALLNITTRGEDDDGQRGGVVQISDEQVAELKALVKDAGADIERFLAHFQIVEIEDLSVRRFSEAKALLLAKKRDKTRGAGQ